MFGFMTSENDTHPLCGWQVVNVPSEYVSPVQSAHTVSVDDVPILKTTITQDTRKKLNKYPSLQGTY